MRRTKVVLEIDARCPGDEVVSTVIARAITNAAKFPMFRDGQLPYGAEMTYEEGDVKVSIRSYHATATDDVDGHSFPYLPVLRGIGISGKELRNALKFGYPDDEEQDKARIVICHREKGEIKDGDGKDLPEGLYAHFEEHPDGEPVFLGDVK